MNHRAWILTATLMIASPAFAQETPAYPAPLVDLREAPISPSALTEGKKEDAAVLILRAAKREKVAAENGFAELLTRQKMRDVALMEMLAPDSAITHAVAAALKEKYGTFLTANVTAENADAIALQMVQSIFLNRRDDLASIHQLYLDPVWQLTIRDRLAEDDVPELNVTLSDDKKAELQNTALYIHTPGKADGKMEPAVHSLLTALGQQIGHAALVDIMKEGSPVHGLFITTVNKSLPDDPAATAWLNEWLYLRAGRAEAVVAEFRPDGALMQDAVSQSETKRRSRLEYPPAITYKP